MWLTAMRTLRDSDLSYKRIVLPKLTNHFPCNPSIVIHKNRILASYRGCNYQLRER